MPNLFGGKVNPDKSMLLALTSGLLLHTWSSCGWLHSAIHHAPRRRALVQDQLVIILFTPDSYYRLPLKNHMVCGYLSSPQSEYYVQRLLTEVHETTKNG